MIIHHVIFGLLLYSTTVRANPLAVKDSSTASNHHTALPDPIDDHFSDTSVDTLITKVVELSERYRTDENGTIADVQHMIHTDKTLPRLTRGEIIDLLENLTNTTPEMWKERITKSRTKYQKAIMLVMPYTPKNDDTLSIEELYTKPPITHIIDNKKSENSNKHIEILALEPSTSRPPIVKRPIKPIKQIKVDSNQENKTTKKEVINKQTSTRFEPTTHKPEQLIKDFVETTTKQVVKPIRFSNHRYPDENGFIPSNKGINIISPPSLIPKPEVVPNRNVRPVQASLHKVVAPSTKRPRITTTTTTTTTTITPYSPLDNLDVPEEIKDGVKDIHFEHIDMTPPKYSSQYDASVMTFPKQESNTENVRDILDTIGVLPQTSTSVPDISGIADHLSPDMRDLLKTFGLIEDPNKPLIPVNEPIISQPEELNISPLSYSQFKPLPESAPTRQDMQEFLAEFGLVGQRSAKKLQTPDEPIKLPTKLSEVPNINMDMIPESLHDVLADIGLSEKKEKKEKKVSIDQETKETHVFNPEQTNVSETEIKRLNKLLETIKRLEKLNRTAVPEDLKDLDLENIKELTKILKQDASLPLDQQNYGPDPFDFDVSPDKNEIKRQQSTTTTESSTTVQANDNLAALAESFGGNTGAGAENVDASLPPPRRTGFYYLVDWNSFLEVGEEGKNKVNIRFSPQAGDASRFLRVNVP